MPRKPRPPAPDNHKPHCFAIRTRIAKAAGEDGNYRLAAIRGLPSTDRGNVLLQATDGRQAVCLLTAGKMAGSRLVPTSVLPGRRLSSDVEVKLVDGQWQSSEGRIAEDIEEPGDGKYPPLAEVLPGVHKRPYYETRSQAEKRRKPDGSIVTPHVVLAIDLAMLTKVADGLGTSKLTLMVPVPVKGPDTPASEVFVNKPVCVCPAENHDQAQGIGVVMPLRPERANSFYEKLRQQVVEAERRFATDRAPRSAASKKGGNGHAQAG